jgi:hypothetical protein
VQLRPIGRLDDRTDPPIWAVEGCSRSRIDNGGCRCDSHRCRYTRGNTPRPLFDAELPLCVLDNSGHFGQYAQPCPVLSSLISGEVGRTS